MKKTYLALGAALVAMSATADGHWQSLNNTKLQDAAYLPGWSGALTAVGEEIGEVWCGAFDLYQEVHNLPAGEYTLTVNAFYRYSNNDESQANMTNGANHNAYIYINDTEVAVEGLFDTVADSYPTWLGEAKDAFNVGRYVNTLKVTCPAGTVKVGIKNYGGKYDEWTAFDNFKLVGPDGEEVALVNADFSAGINAQSAWECTNIADAAKTPDVNKYGGVYRKTNASPYNIGQKVTLEPGKYRFNVQSFLRYGGGSNVTDGYWTVKSAPEFVAGESALDRHNNGTESDHAYIYVTNGWDTDLDGNVCKPTSAEYALDATYGNANGFYLEEPIKCLFDEKYGDTYVENEPESGEEGYTNADGYFWVDSGFEYQAAALFVANPDAYRNYIEFEITETCDVWVGLKKDVNAPTQYWNPWRDIRLEMWVEDAAFESTAADLYLRGGMNSWGTDANYQFYTTEDGGYVLNNVTIAAGEEWKIADSYWSTWDFGGSTSDAVANVSTLDVVYQGKNITLANDFSGNLYVTIAADNKSAVITFDGEYNSLNTISVADSNVAPIYYDLTGRRVNNPENGVFVRVQGSTVTKVIL